MRKNKKKSLFEKRMADNDFRRRFEKEYPAFNLEVQILNALEKKGWTYSKLAKAMGTSKSNISRDLSARGIRLARISRLAKMAQVLDSDFIPLLIPQKKEEKILPEIQKLVAT